MDYYYGYHKAKEVTGPAQKTSLQESVKAFNKRFVVRTMPASGQGFLTSILKVIEQVGEDVVLGLIKRLLGNSDPETLTAHGFKFIPKKEKTK